MKNMNRLTPEEITHLIQEGLNMLIKGFEHIGFRRKTNDRLQLLEDQVALLSKKLLASEES